MVLPEALQRGLARLARGLLWLGFVLGLTFLLLAWLPGDPAAVSADPRVLPEQREALRHVWGLDAPLGLRYLRWLGDVLRGSWGTSWRFHEPVRDLVLRAAGPTLQLTAAALIVQFTCGIGGGILAVRFPRHGGRLLLAGAQAAYAVPLFWLALLSILVFGFELGWLPAGGPGPPGERLRHLLLPVLVLGLGSAAPVLRYTRNALLDTLDEEWMTAARGRGYPPRRLLLRHGLPAVLPGLRQLLALALPSLLSGSLLVEVVFSWPGLGRLAWEAVLARDAPLVLAATAASSAAMVVALELHDVRDPDLRARERRGR